MLVLVVVGGRVARVDLLVTVAASIRPLVRVHVHVVLHARLVIGRVRAQLARVLLVWLVERAEVLLRPIEHGHVFVTRVVGVRRRVSELFGRVGRVHVERRLIVLSCSVVVVVVVVVVDDAAAAAAGVDRCRLLEISVMWCHVTLRPLVEMRLV